MNLALWGKRYIDRLFYLEGRVLLGETNELSRSDLDQGGMYNIHNIRDVEPFYFPEEKKEALIISESDGSRRTSIVNENKQEWICRQEKLINQNLMDWIHIPYIDDFTQPDRILDMHCPISIDFCKTEIRTKYTKHIDKCELVFDSRERKELYNAINTTTPIILHDEYGCECIIEDKVEYSTKIEPINNLHVNGAGDKFAAIFIREYLESGLETAILLTPNLTTESLMRINYEEV